MFGKYYYAIVMEGEFIGIDADSGGYPYKARHPSQVKYWSSYDDAYNYRATFIKPVNASYGWTEDNSKIVKVAVVILS